MFINGELPKDEKYPLSCVYWIHTPEMTDPKTQGYIGVSSRGLAIRYDRHKKDTKAGSQLPVHRAMRKYGDVIVVTSLVEADPEFCLMVEEAFRPVAQMGGRIWNVSAGGGMGMLGAKISQETSRKRSESLKGRIFTEEHKKKIGDAQRGKTLTAAHIEFLREINTGRKHTEEAKKLIRDAVVGRKHSKESLKKMSDVQKARVRSPEEIAKVVARNKLGLSPESALKRNASLSETRRTQPWRNSSVKDTSIWEQSMQIEEYLRLNSSSTISQTAKEFGTTRDKMESIQNKIKSKWSPSSDELFLAWLEEKKGK